VTSAIGEHSHFRHNGNVIVAHADCGGSGNERSRAKSQSACSIVPDRATSVKHAAEASNIPKDIYGRVNTMRLKLLLKRIETVYLHRALFAHCA
jgi:hypothetical protein